MTERWPTGSVQLAIFAWRQDGNGAIAAHIPVRLSANYQRARARCTETCLFLLCLCFSLSERKTKPPTRISQPVPPVHMRQLHPADTWHWERTAYRLSVKEHFRSVCCELPRSLHTLKVSGCNHCEMVIPATRAFTFPKMQCAFWLGYRQLRAASGTQSRTTHPRFEQIRR